MNNRLPSSFQKSAQVHWIQREQKDTLVSETLHTSKVLVEGNLIDYKVKNSFTLNGGTTTELSDFQVISTAKKYLIIIILFEGELDFSYDDIRFRLKAMAEPKGMVVNLTKPATFRRSLKKDNRVFKLNILLPIDWIKERAEQNTKIHTLISQHLASFQLDLTDNILNLSQNIIQNGFPNGILEKIHLETLTQTLLLAIFEQICASNTDQYTEGQEETQTEYSLDNVISYIETNLDQNLSAKKLAKYAGMSESSLQRKFKITLGYSIQSYIRQRRLEIARQHLERGVATVTEVAYNAGYRHPSNFTNAFKKAFGYPPVSAVNKAI